MLSDVHLNQAFLESYEFAFLTKNVCAPSICDFRFIYLGETFSPFQLVGAVVTLAAIYLVNYRNVVE